MTLRSKLLKKASLEEGDIFMSPKGVPPEDIILGMLIDSDEAFWYDGSWSKKIPVEEFTTLVKKNRMVKIPLEIPGRMSGEEILQGGLDGFLKALESKGAPADSASELLHGVWAPMFYKTLGAGASRVAFKVDDYVLKIASGEDTYLGQNKKEWAVGQSETTLPLNRPLHHGPRFEYLLAPFAGKLDPKAFQKIYGMDFRDFCLGQNMSPEGEALRGAMEESDLIDAFQPDNWGMVEGYPVIIDAGI